MPNIYSKNSSEMKNLKPKRETLSFLLGYSKALKVVKTKQMTFDLILN